MATKTLSTLPPGRPKGARTFNQTIATAFGQALRQVRVEKKVSQDTLALRCNIERSYLGKIERGEHIPSLDAFFKIAEGLEMNASDLIVLTQTNIKKSKR